MRPSAVGRADAPTSQITPEDRPPFESGNNLILQTCTGLTGLAQRGTLRYIYRSRSEGIIIASGRISDFSFFNALPS